MVPACVADNVQVPAFTMVMVNVDAVHTAVVEEVSDTVSPDDADGETANVVPDHARSVGAVNDIDCDACEMTKLRDTELAAL